MNDAKFVAAYAAWQKEIPFSHPGKYRTAARELTEFASPEHTPRVEEISYMSDQCRCACGWHSDKFWDGADYALKQWREHVMEEIEGDGDVGCGC